MKISVLFSTEIPMIDTFKIVDKSLHWRMQEWKLYLYVYLYSELDFHSFKNSRLLLLLSKCLFITVYKTVITFGTYALIIPVTGELSSRSLRFSPPSRSGLRSARTICRVLFAKSHCSAFVCMRVLALLSECNSSVHKSASHTYILHRFQAGAGEAIDIVHCIIWLLVSAPVSYTHLTLPTILLV